MQALAHAVHGAVPRFEQFGMGHGLLAAAENLGLLFRRQFVVVGHQIVTVFLKLARELLSFLGVERKDRRFKLLQAHHRSLVFSNLCQ